MFKFGREIGWVGAGALLVLGSSAHAALQNPGFELNSDWSWSTASHGDYVNQLDLTPNTNFVPPYAGNRFGYAENSLSQNPVTISQLNAFVDGPVLEFWYFFFTNEPAVEGNNDRFDVTVSGDSGSEFQVITTVNSASFITTNAPLVTPAPTVGQGQSFARYTVWTQYLLDVSSLLGETVAIDFTVRDGPSTHGQSSGFGIDNVQFVPEPASLALLALGGATMLRRRR